MQTNREKAFYWCGRFLFDIMQCHQFSISKGSCGARNIGDIKTHAWMLQEAKIMLHSLTQLEAGDSTVQTEISRASIFKDFDNFD